MEYQDINEVVNDHFSSFDRLSVENRKISIVQSTRLILSILKFKIIREVRDNDGDYIKELFKTLDTSLNYIISKDAISDLLYNKSATGLDMKSDISDISDNDDNGDNGDICDDGDDINHDDRDEKEKDRENVALKIIKKNLVTISSDDDESSTSLNSIYSVSLNSPIKNKHKEDDKGKEPEDENEGGEGENDIVELFSKSHHPYFVDKIQRIEDDKFHELLRSLRSVNIYTHAPYKLHRMLKYHSSFFKDKKDILTCSVYSLPVNEGHINMIVDYFGFDK